MISKKSTLDQASLSIPWSLCFNESVQLVCNHPILFLSFFTFFSSVSFISQVVDFDWENIVPTDLWLSLSLSLTALSLSFFVLVVFILWIKAQKKGLLKLEILKLFQESSLLLLPLTLLSIRCALILFLGVLCFIVPGLYWLYEYQLTLLSVRGALVSFLGVLCFIVPGLYWIFKYQLATVCLILEGWNQDGSPVQTAERLIARYRLRTSLLPTLVLVSLFLTWLIEIWLKYMKWNSFLGVKLVLCLLDGSLTLGFSTFLSLLVLKMLEDSSRSSS